MSDRAFDPRWEWHEILIFGDRDPIYVRGRCNHLETEPVTTLTGEHVAQLCLTCDAQLPPGTPHPAFRGPGMSYVNAETARRDLE